MGLILIRLVAVIACHLVVMVLYGHHKRLPLSPVNTAAKDTLPRLSHCRYPRPTRSEPCSKPSHKQISNVHQQCCNSWLHAWTYV